MADCNETIRELDAFLDGELTETIRVSIHEHLDGCVDCLQAFEFHVELKAAIRRKCSNDELPAGLLDRIRQCFDPQFDPQLDPRVDPQLDARLDPGGDERNW